MAEAIGYLALLITVLSLQSRQTKYMYLLQGLSGLIFCIHLLLLGGYTGAVTRFVIRKSMKHKEYLTIEFSSCRQVFSRYEAASI